MRKPCFTLCLFSRCFMVLWVMFSIIYALLLSSHHILVPLVGLFLDAYTSSILHWLSVGHAFILVLLCFIDCMFGWSFSLLYDHCGHFHMIVMCLIKLLICFITCLLDRNLLITLYLSFYHLIYLEGLMCFMQVFQATGIYVPSATQVLDLGVSEFCHCSQTYV